MLFNKTNEKIEDEDLIQMMSNVADQMLIEGKEKMERTKLGITCYAGTKSEDEIYFTYSINWEEVYLYLEEFIRANVRYFYCWNMGIEMFANPEKEDPIELQCNRKKIEKGKNIPRFIAELTGEEDKHWEFSTASWS